MEDPVSDVEFALLLHCVEDEPVAVWWVVGVADVWLEKVSYVKTLSNFCAVMLNFGP